MAGACKGVEATKGVPWPRALMEGPLWAPHAALHARTFPPTNRVSQPSRPLDAAAKRTQRSKKKKKKGKGSKDDVDKGFEEAQVCVRTRGLN